MKKIIAVWLIILVIVLSSVSFYNYNIQKNILLKQMQANAYDIADSITYALKRFNTIKSAINIDKLVYDMSLNLNIFEFRYIEPNGIIRNSMFKKEIGQLYTNKSFKQVKQGDIKFKELFLEERDFVKVMAIYYPIVVNDTIVGIIDLAVALRDNVLYDNNSVELEERKSDILNLLKAFEGSIKNSIYVSESINIKTFIDTYVNKTKNIFQITIIDYDGSVIVSSDNSLLGKTLKIDSLQNNYLFILDGKQFYRILSNKSLHCQKNDRQLLLLIDATFYKKNKQALFETALITSILALFVALLIARIIYYSALKESKKEKEKLEKLVQERTLEIDHLSKIDALTGIWNRGCLEKMMKTEFERSIRYKHPFSIAIIDLDNFKMINDNNGHLAGDEVLRQVSKKIVSSIRKVDFVGRYGGEEFVIIFIETDIKTAEILSNKIRKIVENTHIIYENKTIKVTTSIGLSSLRSEHKDPFTVFSEADEALYKAKKEGKNKVTVYRKSDR